LLEVKLPRSRAIARSTTVAQSPEPDPEPEPLKSNAGVGELVGEVVGPAVGDVGALDGAAVGDAVGAVGAAVGAMDWVKFARDMGPNDGPVIENAAASSGQPLVRVASHTHTLPAGTTPPGRKPSGCAPHTSMV
jgi:hypothetical protein